MKTYTFKLITICSQPEHDELVKKLGEATEQDCFCQYYTEKGELHVTFERSATSLDKAISLALSEVGDILSVNHLEIDNKHLMPLIL